MLIDAFLLSGELDLLELRLNELNPIIDKFVIVESLEKFGSLDTKSASLLQNWPRFKEFESKIHYILLDKLEPPYMDVYSAWRRELFQRNALMKGIIAVASSKDDKVLISDCDEIPNTDTVLKNLHRVELYRLKVRMYYYNVNRFVGDWPWCGPVLGTIQNIEDIGGCENARCFDYVPSGKVIDDGGWHFSYFGSIDRIRAKVNSFSHSTDDFCEEMLKRSDDEILKDVRAGKDLFRREDRTFEYFPSNHPNLPKTFLQNPEKYKIFTEEYANRGNELSS